MARTVSLQQGREKAHFHIYTQSSSLDCLRKYASRTLNALRILENQWEFSRASEEFLTISKFTMVKINTLFKSYEMMVIEFDEYCEALEIPELGKSMMKMFVQVLSIAEKILRSYAANIQEIEKKANKNRNCERCEGEIKNKIEESRKSKEFYIKKERIRFEAELIQNDLKRIEKNISAENQREITKKLEESMAKVVQIQSSNAENLIVDVMAQIQNRNSSLMNFISHRNKLMKGEDINEASKIAQAIKDEINNDNQKKTRKAVSKLYEIFKQFFLKQEKVKRDLLFPMSCQTDDIKLAPEEKSAYEAQITKLTKEIEQYKFISEVEKIKKTNLSSLMEQKTIKFEEQLFRNRQNIIKLQKDVEIAHSKLAMMNQQLQIASKQSEKISRVSRNSNLSRNLAEIEEQNVPLNEVKVAEMQKSISVKNSGKRERRKFERKTYRPHEEQCEKQANKEQKLGQDIEKGNKRQKFIQVLSEKIEPSIKSDNLTLTSQKYAIQIVNSNIEESSHDDNKFTSLVPKFLHQNRIIQNSTSQKRKSKERQKLKQSSQFSINFKFIQSDKLWVEKQIGQEGKKSKIFQKSGQLRKKKNKIAWPSSKSKEPKYNSHQNKQNEQHGKDKNRELFVGYEQNPRKQDTYDLSQPTFKVRAKKQRIQGCLFSYEDVQELFLENKRAMDFQLLNFNIGSCRRQADSVDSLRSLRFAAHKPIQTQTQTLHKDHNKNQIGLSIKRQDYLVAMISRHLDFMKVGNRKKYDSIVTFLKYPFSLGQGKPAIQSHNRYNSMCEAGQELQEGQLKRIYSRLEKIHEKCENKDQRAKVCSHIHRFLQKIGLCITEIMSK